MSARAFLDTNILVYAAAGSNDEEAKQRRAFELIESEDFGTSAQVLQEFFVTVVKKSAHRLSVAEAMEWIEQLVAFPCQAVDHRLVQLGIERAQRYRLSYWDGAIIAAAEALGTDTIYSEDLNHGQRYGNVRVVNPFRVTN